MPRKTAAGADSLLMLPPTEDVLIGVWRAEAIVTGERIKKVIFLVDGKLQLATSKAPYSAEVRLSSFPTEQTVRAEGYDDDGRAGRRRRGDPQPAARRLQRADRRRRPRGPGSQGNRAQTKAEVVVPDGRRLRDDGVPGQRPAHHLADQAALAGRGAGAGRRPRLPDRGGDPRRRHPQRGGAVLRAPQYVSEVDVDLVELYAAVTDRSSNLVNGLKQDDFEVYESGKKQELAKFEQVRNLPLTVGMLIDTSGSMASSLSATQTAAAGFLQSVMKPGDKAFAVSFARRPRLEMPPTDDIDAVTQSISGLQAVGDTALHDALVHSLYYFRGMKGQRALVLLSDGDDNASYITFKDAMEYASRSGVAVYAIGLNLTFFDTGIKAKLGELAAASGGRAFFTNKPAGAAGDLQADRDRAAQPLPAGLQLHRGGRPDRLPSGRGQGEEVGPQGADGEGVLPVRALFSRPRPHRAHRLRARGAQGGDGTGHERDEGEHGHHSGRRQRVGRGDAVELTLDQLSQGVEAGQAEDDPEGGEPQPLAEDEPRYLPDLSAERQPEGDLPPPPRHAVGHHSIDADRGEQQGDPGEEAGQQQSQPAVGQAVAHRVGERAQLDPLELWIERRHARAHRRGERRVAPRRPQHIGAAVQGVLAHRQVDLRRGLLRERALPDVAHDAHDLPHRARRVDLARPAQLEPPADSVTAVAVE